MPVALNLHLEMKLGYYDEENIEVLKKKEAGKRVGKKPWLDGKDAEGGEFAVATARMGSGGRS